MVDTIAHPSLSYLLRLWAEDNDGQWVWRVSLQRIPAKESSYQPINFASLEDATVYLYAKMIRSE